MDTWTSTTHEHPAESAGLDAPNPDGVDAAHQVTGGMLAVIVLLSAALLTAGALLVAAGAVR